MMKRAWRASRTRGDGEMGVRISYDHPLGPWQGYLFGIERWMVGACVMSNWAASIAFGPRSTMVALRGSFQWWT